MAPEFWDDELADAIGEAADVRRSGGCPGERGCGGLGRDDELDDTIGESVDMRCLVAPEGNFSFLSGKAPRGGGEYSQGEAISP